MADEKDIVIQSLKSRITTLEESLKRKTADMEKQRKQHEAKCKEYEDLCDFYENTMIEMKKAQME